MRERHFSTQHPLKKNTRRHTNRPVERERAQAHVALPCDISPGTSKIARTPRGKTPQPPNTKKRLIALRPSMLYRDLLLILHNHGWRIERQVGSHLQLRHPTRLGTVTLAAGGKLSHDVPTGTLRSVLKQAGISRRPQ